MLNVEGLACLIKKRILNIEQGTLNIEVSACLA